MLVLTRRLVLLMAAERMRRTLKTGTAQTKQTFNIVFRVFSFLTIWAKTLTYAFSLEADVKLHVNFLICGRLAE